MSYCVNTTDSPSDDDAKHLLNLNSDVILEILSYLDEVTLTSVALTCKRLKTIAYSPRLWRDSAAIIDIGCSDGGLTEQTADSYRERRITTAIVRLDGAEKVDASEVAKILEVLATRVETESLVFGNKRPTYKQTEFAYNPTGWISSLPKRFDSLRHLHIQDVLAEPDFLQCDYLNFLENALSQLVNLTQLNFTFFLTSEEPGLDAPPSAEKFMQLNYLEVILRSLPKLVDLSIAERIIHQRSLKVPPTKKEIPEGIQYPNLKRFSISQAVLNRKLLTIRIPEIFPNLKHLGIICNAYPEQTRVDTGSIKAITSELHGLESLEFHMENPSVKVSDMFPDEPFESIKALGIGTSTWPGNLDTIIAACPHLRVLKVPDINDCGKILGSLNNLEIFNCFASRYRTLKNEPYKSLKPDTSEIRHIKNQKPGLKSLLGVSCMNSVGVQPASLKFVTTTKYNKSTGLAAYELMYKSSQGWRALSMLSPRWHEGFGSRYFIPASSNWNLDDLSYELKVFEPESDYE